MIPNCRFRIAVTAVALSIGTASADPIDLGKIEDALGKSPGQASSSRDKAASPLSANKAQATPITSAELVMFIDMTVKGASEAEIAAALEKMRIGFPSK